MSAAFIVLNLVWIYWAGRIASDHGLRPGWYRFLGFLLGPVGVVLSVWLVRNQLRRDHAASGSNLPVRSLPGFGAPVVVCLLVLAPITFFWARALQEQRAADQASSRPPVTYLPVLGADGMAFTELDQPAGVAVDGAGTIYVADLANQRIVMVPKGGTPKTFAHGITDLTGLALDGSGTVFATTHTATWRLRPRTGESTRVEVDGEPLVAVGLAFDRAGNMLFPSSTGVSKLAPDGSRSQVQTGMRSPTAVAVTPSGTVVAVDHDANRVYERRDGKTVVHEDPQLMGPRAVAVDGHENFYVAYTDRVVKFAPDGGRRTIGTFSSDGMTVVAGVAADANGDVFVTFEDQLVELPAAGGQVVLIAQPARTTTTTTATGYVGQEARQCTPDYVWREAFEGDHVCVLPSSRLRAAEDNAARELRRVSPSDPTCKQGWVWRGAKEGDLVCVTGTTRADTETENAEADQHVAG